MTYDLGRVLARSFHISWRYKWLWILGVFGGAGGANFRFNQGGNGGNSAQVGNFVNDHLALILGAVAVIVVITLIAFVIACVAVPASIWAGLQLDAGAEVGLRRSWRAGQGWGWRYFRLTLLKAGIALVLVVVAALLVLLGFGIYSMGGAGTIPILVIGGILVVLAIIGASVFYGFALLWSDRMLVILDVGAVDAVRWGWRLVRQEKFNSVLFWFVFGVIKFFISIGLFLAALVVAAPGIVMALAYLAFHGALVLGIFGIVWITVLGVGALLVGAGYVGALTQVGYALAARDLAIGKGMAVRPEVIGWDPYAAVPVPAT